MYQDVTGSIRIPQIFFVIFWCCVVLILLNVLIALILEIYSSVEPEVYESAKRQKLTRDLAKIVDVKDAETLQERFSEVKLKLC